MRIVKLTDANDAATSVYIIVENILYFHKRTNDSYSRVVFGKEHIIEVSETPEEILKIINASR
jgi:hypothetical protein